MGEKTREISKGNDIKPATSEPIISVIIILLYLLTGLV